MSRKMDTDITIGTYDNCLEDRYLVGYIRDTKRNKKIPIIWGFNFQRKEAFIKNASAAIEDQKVINEMKGVTDKIKCSSRVLLSEPLIYYGFSKENTKMKPAEETKYRQQLRELNMMLGSREADRIMLGDEVACMVGKFDTPKGVLVGAVGKIKRANNTEEVLHQYFIQETDELKVNITAIGDEGLGWPHDKPATGCYYSWNITSKYLGTPKFALECVSKQGREKRIYTLDYNGEGRWVRIQ